MQAEFNSDDLKLFLDSKVAQYNHPSFVKDDPVSIPRRFSLQQDIEIAGFFAAILAWGNRKTIINSCNLLFDLMDGAPYQFVQQHDQKDLVRFNRFVHRTFNADDLYSLLDFMQRHYARHASLETAFVQWMKPGDVTVERALDGFHAYIFSSPEEYPRRTRKHIARPSGKSTCKRLNMFLRWMVRDDTNGVDFGIWKNIRMSQLVCPVDVHVERVARKLQLLRRKQRDWQAALELTQSLRELDAEDPVQYDFALFGLGVMEKF